MSKEVIEAALGVGSPWFVADMDFDESEHMLTIQIDSQRGSRFEVPDVEGRHPVHDTVIKRYRNLNFFQCECVLEVRVPRVKLPDGSVRQVSPPWAGKLSGFTLLFESLAADAERRAVIFVTEGKGADTIRGAG